MATSDLPVCSAKLPAGSGCGRPARVLFTVGSWSVEPIPRCEAHAREMRDGLRSYLREGTWSEQILEPEK
jgi:hypothetical protein